MSGWRDLAARLLQRTGASVSPGLGDWLAAALAELPAIPRTGAAIGWVLGIGAMVAADLLGQALFPWRRDPGQRPPARFAALLGLATVAGLVVGWGLAIVGVVKRTRYHKARMAGWPGDA